MKKIFFLFLILFVVFTVFQFVGVVQAGTCKCHVEDCLITWEDESTSFLDYNVIITDLSDSACVSSIAGPGIQSQIPASAAESQCPYDNPIICLYTCDDDSDCDIGGASCYDGICKKKKSDGDSCIGDIDCESSICNDCTKVCSTISECPPGETCDTDNKQCVATSLDVPDEPVIPEGEEGGDCTADSDCDNELFCNICTSTCSIEADCLPNQYCESNDWNKACVDKKSNDTECIYDAECLNGICNDCTYKCTDEEGCTGGTTCDTTNHLCVEKSDGGGSGSGDDSSGGNPPAEDTSKKETTKVTPKSKTVSEEVSEKIALFEKKGIISGTPQSFIGTIIKSFMGIVGTIALVMFIYGGISWMLAGGDSTKVSNAKGTFIWAALGLVIIFASYALVSYIINAL